MATGAVAALDFLQSPEKYPIAPVCVVFGDEAFLRTEVFRTIRSLVLPDDEADFSLTRYDGAAVSFVDAIRETSTLAMFGSGKRLVQIESADSFISQNRDKLETYFDEPAASGVLLLQPNSFPSNLRLYKKAVAKGLVVDCKAIPQKQIPGWLTRWTPKSCGAKISKDAAETLVELVGDDLGALDQEAKRLALLANPPGELTVELVQTQVGAWRQKKVWDMIDAALGGQTAEALRQLDKLLTAGEAPIAILAQAAATLRKLAAATELFVETEAAGAVPNMTTILDKVGVKPFFRAKYAEQLKKLGRRRGERLAQALLEADVDLKGGSRSDPRLTLERFLVRFSSPEARPFGTLR
ncbi:MAG: DNA polymerase III subunit delta [Thermoguttaceae bacterium]|nr:DNA polymerase III subunit delta [Thermoguttaceae bacterium]